MEQCRPTVMYNASTNTRENVYLVWLQAHQALSPMLLTNEFRDCYQTERQSWNDQTQARSIMANEA